MKTANSLFLFCSFVLSTIAQETSPKGCMWENSENPATMTFRHIESAGIGYNQGYSSLDLFITPGTYNGWYPLVDFRGHIFDNGRLASNVGIGLRYLNTRCVWGGNFYYDYRSTNFHHSYNQIAWGLESLGLWKIWDFRVNGYLPVGNKKSSLKDLQFGFFQGNFAFLRQKYEFAFGGFNAEAGVHVDQIPNIPFYFSGGPYYLVGRGNALWGGEMHAEVGVFEYLQIQGNLSYDHIFKWIGQGQIGLNIPLGRKEKNEPSPPTHSCSNDVILARRAVERVKRHEIIPVDRKRKTSLAIDPATGAPFFFLFVDNTSHSAGSYESPFPTLLQAQSASNPYNIIAIFPGDGTTSGLSGGITMKPQQQLWGLGTSHQLSTTLGSITIPSQSNTMPRITNTGGDVVTLSDGNTIEGLDIRNTNGRGLYGSAITNLVAADNTISGGAAGEGIYLTNMQGTIVIENSTFNQTAKTGNVQNAAISLNLGNSVNASQCQISCNNNQHNGATSVRGIATTLGTSAQLGSLSILRGTFNNLSDPTASQNGGAISTVINSGATLSTLSITNGTFSNNSVGTSGNGSGGAISTTVNGTLSTFSITGGTFSTNSAGEDGGAISTLVGGTLTSLSITGGTFSNNTAVGGDGGAISTLVATGGTLTSLSIAGGTFTNNSAEDQGENGGAISTTINSGGTLGTLSIANGTFSNNRAGASGSGSGGAISTYITGPLTTLSITGGTFSNNSAAEFGGAISTLVGAAVGTLSITGGTFTTNSASAAAGGGAIYCVINPGSLTNGDVSNNALTVVGSNIGNGGFLLPNQSSTPVKWLVSNNSFTATASSFTQGMAVTIQQTGTGSTCVTFTNNTANPTTTNPYLFSQTAGTFNQATISGNTPTVTTSGTVGAPGSCTP